MSELFSESEVTKDSPRLTWLKQHNLALGQLPDGTRFCAGRNSIGYGDTHRDAELDYSESVDLEHWEITDFKRAGVVLPEEREEW